MQRLRHSLLSMARIGAEAVWGGASARVGGQADATSLAQARQQTTAVAERVAGLDRADPNYVQHLKAALRPENSGRNQFRRKWSKGLQIKWNAHERKVNEAANKLAREEKRKELWAKRRQWKEEAAGPAPAAP